MNYSSFPWSISLPPLCAVPFLPITTHFKWSSFRLKAVWSPVLEVALELGEAEVPFFLPCGWVSSSDSRKYFLIEQSGLSFTAGGLSQWVNLDLYVVLSAFSLYLICPASSYGRWYYSHPSVNEQRLRHVNLINKNFGRRKFGRYHFLIPELLFIITRFPVGASANFWPPLSLPSSAFRCYRAFLGELTLESTLEPQPGIYQSYVYSLFLFSTHNLGEQIVFCGFSDYLEVDGRLIPRHKNLTHYLPDLSVISSPRCADGYRAPPGTRRTHLGAWNVSVNMQEGFLILLRKWRWKLHGCCWT